jgi:glycosyltransferase involved in cell wall biosynthesis
MPIRIVNPYGPNDRTGVPQFNARLQAAFAHHGLDVPWESTEPWANGTVKGDPSRDILIVTNEDAVRMPPDIAVIAMQHGCAIQRFSRSGEPWFKDIDPVQLAASKRPKTYWVACSDECAHEYFKHHGYHADRIIFNGLDTDRFFPSDRQILKDRTRPVVLNHCVGPGKGGEQIGAVAAELGDEFLVRTLNAPVEAVPEAMRTSDMFLCLSITEGCPGVVNEALATGLVVVSTDVALYWRAEGAPPGVRMRWQDRGNPKVVADAVREAWKNRMAFDGRRWALRWLGLGCFGQQWIFAVEEACKRFGVQP